MIFEQNNPLPAYGGADTAHRISSPEAGGFLVAIMDFNLHTEKGKPVKVSKGREYKVVSSDEKAVVVRIGGKNIAYSATVGLVGYKWFQFFKIKM